MIHFLLQYKIWHKAPIFFYIKFHNFATDPSGFPNSYSPIEKPVGIKKATIVLMVALALIEMQGCLGLGYVSNVTVIYLVAFGAKAPTIEDTDPLIVSAW